MISPSSETPSWDGVSVWIPNTSISKTSIASSALKSPCSPHQIFTPTTTLFRTDTSVPSLDNSNEKIDEGNPFLRGSNSPLLQNSHKRYDSFTENKLTRKDSLKAPQSFYGISSEKNKSNSDILRYKPNHLQNRDLIVNKYISQESKSCVFKNKEAALNNTPQRQLCPDFLKPLEVLKKKLEMLEEQERLSISHSEGSACQGESISSFFSFEDSLDRALEAQDCFVDNSIFHETYFQENFRLKSEILENIQTPEVSEINNFNSRDNHITDEIIRSDDNKTSFITKVKEPSYSFVPNGQFLKLIEEKEAIDFTQVILNGKENQNSNYFFKLHSNKKSENHSDQDSDNLSDKRLLNIRGILADIKKTIDNSQTNLSYYENKKDVPTSQLNRISQIPFATNKLAHTNISSNETSNLKNLDQDATRPNDSNNMVNISSNNFQNSKIHSSENLNFLERQYSFRKLSPEKIKEINEWAGKTVSGYKRGNRKTGKIHFLKRHEAKSWNHTSKENLKNTLASPINNKTKHTSSLDDVISNSHPYNYTSYDKYKEISFLSSTETSLVNLRQARMRAFEASLDDIFDDFLERTLLSKLPYIDDFTTAPKDGPVNYFSTSNLFNQHHLENVSNFKHLKTLSDQNLVSSTFHNDNGYAYNSKSKFDYQLQNNSFQLMTFKDELTLLRSRLLEQIHCLESENTVKLMLMEKKCFFLNQIVVETFGMNKNVQTQQVTSPFRKKNFVTNIKKVVMTCESKDTVQSLKKSHNGHQGQTYSSGKMETMIDGPESESDEFLTPHLFNQSNKSSEDEGDDRNSEAYVIVLRDGITIEGIHATVPKGNHVPIQVQQHDLKNNFEAAFQALCDKDLSSL